MAPDAGPLLVAPSPTSPPPGFVRSVYERTWHLDRDRERVWAWLCDPATFVEGQIWPYRVEFLPDDHGPGEFRRGVYNSHVGPGMCFAGVIGDIEPGRYRDLQYCYGSYAVSHALFRPTRLQFWADDDPGGGTVLRLQVDAHVRRRFAGLWLRAVSVFFGSFGRWAARATRPDGA